MSYATLDLSTDARGVARLVLNRPDKHNALSAQMLADLTDAADRLAADAAVRVVVLTGAGKSFCAGGDLNVLIDRRKLSEPERRAKVDDLHDLVRGIRACPVPVIAAVEGGAAGAGASLAFACDLIVAAEGAKFTAAYVKAGLVPDAGLTSALSRMIPRQLAMEMCLMARPVTAERLHALGAVNAVVPAGEAEAEAMRLADALAQGPRGAQGAIRRLVAQAYEATEAQQLDAERDHMAAAAGGHEAAEGIAAFLDKRAPRFGG
jgi:enoyl-CoA hydratase/carnithine racemase